MRTPSRIPIDVFGFLFETFPSQFPKSVVRNKRPSVIVQEGPLCFLAAILQVLLEQHGFRQGFLNATRRSPHQFSTIVELLFPTHVPTSGGDVAETFRRLRAHFADALRLVTTTRKFVHMPRPSNAPTLLGKVRDFEQSLQPTCLYLGTTVSMLTADRAAGHAVALLPRGQKDALALYNWGEVYRGDEKVVEQLEFLLERFGPLVYIDHFVEHDFRARRLEF
jgi:hypothetical protein